MQLSLSLLYWLPTVIVTMNIIYKLLLVEIISLYFLYQIGASPLLPQEDDTESEEDSGEDVDDVYDEEKNETTTEAVVSKEKPDKDELEDALQREILAKRLGVKNFSAAAIAEKASALTIAYILSRPSALPAPPRKKKEKVSSTPPPGLVATTLKPGKYKVKKQQQTTTERPIMSNITDQLIDSNTTKSNLSIPMRSFVFTVPKMSNGTGGGTIEINLPMPMMTSIHTKAPMEEDDELELPSQESMLLGHQSSMAISSQDIQGIKNIEAAIMEALRIAQQIATLNMSMSMDNNTETIELDIGDISMAMITPAEAADNTEPTVATINTTEHIEMTSEALTSPPLEDLPPPETTTLAPEPSSTSKPKRKRIRSTTPRATSPDDPLGVGPVTDIVVSQIRNGQLPQFLWTSVIKLANSEYMQIAVDAVECAIFYYCPDDTELGTLTKGGKF